MINELPFYIERGGEQVFSPPFESRGVRLYGFVFPLQSGEGAQSTLDRSLKTPTGGVTDYRLAAPFVLVTFAHMGPLASLTTPDADKGFFEYDEAAVWLLTMALEAGSTPPRVDRLAWFIPYMFAELSQAVCCGREIYGYPKQYGWINGIEVASSTGMPETLSLQTVVLPSFEASTRAVRQALFEVKRIDNADNNSTNAGLAKTEDTANTADVESFAERVGDDWKAFLEGMRALLGLAAGLEFPDLNFVLNLGEYALHHEAPMVYLKQFRDVQEGSRACYQAIIEASGQIENVRESRLLPGQYQLTIHHADSHPLCTDLGISPSQNALLAFAIEFDLGIETGREVWKART